MKLCHVVVHSILVLIRVERLKLLKNMVYPNLVLKIRVAIKKEIKLSCTLNTPSRKLSKNVHFNISQLLPKPPFQFKVTRQIYYVLPSKGYDLYISYICVYFGANVGTLFRMNVSCMCFGWDPNVNENISSTTERFPFYTISSR